MTWIFFITIRLLVSNYLRCHSRKTTSEEFQCEFNPRWKLLCYYLEYSDYWPHLYCYTHNISTDMFLGLLQAFHVELGSHTESQTGPFIWTTGVNCSNSLNHDRAEVLSYSKYSLLFLPVVGIEPATSRWFHSDTLSSQTP